MAIGLTSEQLANVFINSLLTRQTQFHAEIITAEIGFDPKLNNIISLLREKYADVLTVHQFNSIMSIIFAFMDSIVSNNNELAKILPHNQT